jgi:hypothetical protein
VDNRFTPLADVLKLRLYRPGPVTSRDPPIHVPLSNKHLSNARHVFALRTSAGIISVFDFWSIRSQPISDLPWVFDRRLSRDKVDSAICFQIRLDSPKFDTAGQWSSSWSSVKIPQLWSTNNLSLPTGSQVEERREISFCEKSRSDPIVHWGRDDDPEERVWKMIREVDGGYWSPYSRKWSGTENRKRDWNDWLLKTDIARKLRLSTSQHWDNIPLQGLLFLPTNSTLICSKPSTLNRRSMFPKSGSVQSAFALTFVLVTFCGTCSWTTIVLSTPRSRLWRLVGSNSS